MAQNTANHLFLTSGKALMLTFLRSPAVPAKRIALRRPETCAVEAPFAASGHLYALTILPAPPLLPIDSPSVRRNFTGLMTPTCEMLEAGVKIKAEAPRHGAPHVPQTDAATGGAWANAEARQCRAAPEMVGLGPRAETRVQQKCRTA